MPSVVNYRTDCWDCGTMRRRPSGAAVNLGHWTHVRSAGEIRLDGRAGGWAAVERMAATMADRGPDDSGAWASGRCAGPPEAEISTCRLPAGSRSSILWLHHRRVHNGCIGNYRESRATNSPPKATGFSHGDSEVVIKAYAEWGEAFVEHLIGMFAVAIVERDNHRVVLARDRLGTADAHRRGHEHRAVRIDRCPPCWPQEESTPASTRWPWRHT